MGSSVAVVADVAHHHCPAVAEHLSHRAERREHRRVALIAAGPLVTWCAVRAEAVVRLGVSDDLAITWRSSVLGNHQNSGADHLPTEVISGGVHELVSRDHVGPEDRKSTRLN